MRYEHTKYINLIYLYILQSVALPVSDRSLTTIINRIEMPENIMGISVSPLDLYNYYKVSLIPR